MTFVRFKQGVLLPRLRETAASEIRNDLRKQSPDISSFDPIVFDSHLEQLVDYPATGGAPVDRRALLALRERFSALRPLESEERTVRNKAGFDKVAGQILWESSEEIPGEFGNPAVWDFLTLVLLPDFATWRFDAQQASRFVGGSRRHVFQRLWKRWAAFGEDLVLSDRLTEDDYVALLERRLTSERRLVARQVAETIRKLPDVEETVVEREYTRRFMRHLRQLSGVVAIDDSDPSAIREVIQYVDGVVRNELSRPRTGDRSAIG